MWWKWTAPEADSFFFDTRGSNFDTIMAVYTGASLINALTVIASNDDEGDNKTSGVVFEAQAGVQYNTEAKNDNKSY